MQKKQFGRSMIEMLGVLAIIGVLSIGGLLGYRRAVNNHQANVILDDVNRFAFVIIEKGNYPLGEDLPKGDFKESGIYTLTGHQALSAGQFSILVSNVPKGVCEVLLDKATVEYKIGVVTAGGSVDNEIVYDTLHKDICNNDVNDIAFYFGDTSGVCNAPEGEGSCTSNGDCCGGEFCWFPNNSDTWNAGLGTCKKLTNTNFLGETKTMSDGNTWTRSEKGMNWWSARNWCEAQGLKSATRADIGCGSVRSGSVCSSTQFTAIKDVWPKGCHWLEDFEQYGYAYYTAFSDGPISAYYRYIIDNRYALCR